jgi:hypothetical protein
MDVFDLKEGTARKILRMRWKKISKKEKWSRHILLCICVEDEGVVDGEDSTEEK